jgi:hypothetical protein
MRTVLSILAISALGAGCATVPDERDPVAYYQQKDRAEAERQAAKASQDASGNAVGQSFQLLTDRMNGTTPLELARRMEDSSSADNRRKGINGLVRRPFAQRAPYTTRYREIAVGISSEGLPADPDYVVRATAVRALNRARDAESTPVFIQALSDASELVRLEGVKALNNLPDPAAAPQLMKLLSDKNESMEVRIAAAEALRHYKTLEVARMLIAVLDERDFGVAWQARRSLQRLTNADNGYDQGKWLSYITGPAQPFG